MNVKRILLSLLILIVMLTITVVPSITLASSSGTIYVGITETRTKLDNDTIDTDNIGYAIGNPKSNAGTGNSANIWALSEYTDANNGSLKSNGSKNIYCVKAGIGFTDAKKRATYNISYDMNKEREEIQAQNGVLASIVTGNIPNGNEQVGKYESILALLDMFYLVDDSRDDDVKVNYLKTAGINPDEYDFILTRDDILAIQQAALWYFTNYYQKTDDSSNYSETTVHDEKYDKLEATGWLNYTSDGNTYQSLSGYHSTTPVNENTDSGRQRQMQAEQLYKYLIQTAKKNAKNYTNTEKLGAPASLTTKSLNYTISGSNYIVGPIKITEQENNGKSYTIDLTVKNGTNVLEKGTGYKLLDSKKTEVASEKTIKDLVNNDFYISIPKENVTTISVNTSIKYSTTKLTLWASTTNNQEQPLVLPEKKEQTDTGELKVTPDAKPFDLALRKYITKVDGVELENTSSRVPVIDESTLQNGTTATYKHKKDPVVIKTGSIVTYKITVYNEGEKEGRATEIIDQLPTGLEFIEEDVKGNFDATYNKDNNTVTFKRKSTNQENLAAYAGEGTLKSETIEFTCKVTEQPDESKNKVLTNIAWISKEYDAVSGKDITNIGDDRDSLPTNHPNASKNTMENYKGNTNNKDTLNDSKYHYEGEQDDDDFEKLVLLPDSFDLKLIKRITEVNGQTVPERIEKVDVSKLNTLDEQGNLITTGEYTLSKDPVPVQKGDIVTYTFRIYNEGTIDGYASEITEDVPEGLEFIYSTKTGEQLETDTTLTPEEKEAVKFNQKYLWGNFKYDEAREKIVEISTDYLSKAKETTINGNLIKAFGNNDGNKTEADISYKEVSVKFKVVSNNITGTIIRNEACISEDTNSEGNPIVDRDSDTEDWIGKRDPEHYEDDEDYDNVILKSFDLALRKFIIAISKDETVENNEYLKNTDGSYKRAPKVDTSKLNTEDAEGNYITTADYNHTKEPVQVRKGDIVVYMLRVYNEGEIDGYAGEIKDHLPPYLEFVEGDFNDEYGWKVSEDGRTVTTTYLKDSKIVKAVKNENPATPEETYTLSYKEVPIMCHVTDNAKTNENITNIADITEYLDENKDNVTDRDSQEDNVVLPEDDKLPTYKDDETGSYVPGQQDDDDFEKVVIRRFDLALRKFITKIEDKDVTTRIPQVKYEDGKITYEHSKDPLMVATGNTVIYTIRVFNEGELAGYASEITDDIPEGLEFLPDNDVNKQMRWVMEDEQGNKTEDVSKATKITTDYLSKDNEKTNGENLLKAFNPNAEISDTNPDHRDLKVAFKVTEPNSSDRIIINSAQISEDTDENGNDIDDDDSIPDEWNDGEDDQDNEYIKVAEFDLALRKWVTQAIVIENGKQTVTNTGHGPYDNPEQAVKVELNRKKLDQVTVKFRYSIRVINEGNIAGYAKEITDYIPEGLKFIAADNPQWKDEGNRVISTRALENTLLQPGQYADVEVLLTWENNKDNLGLKTNTAEISEDYNDYGIPDKDSTPDNKKTGEDDIDDAPVLLSVSTGQVRIYYTLGFIILITVAGGVILIKKFVL